MTKTGLGTHLAPMASQICWLLGSRPQMQPEAPFCNNAVNEGSQASGRTPQEGEGAWEKQAIGKAVHEDQPYTTPIPP